nr:hypothetical protein [uncultured Campylobacter sp.]
MKIIGHELVPFEPFISCKNLAQLAQNSDKNVLIKFNDTLIKTAVQNGLNFGVYASNLTQLLLANACGAKFIIVPKRLAKDAADTAQEYLFDAQICVVLDGESELEWLSKTGADVAIFKEGIRNGNF